MASCMGSNKMKHPQQNTENFEFNLGQALNLRCLQTPGATFCGQCQNCRVREIIIETRQWFLKAGEQTKRRLVHELVRRAHSTQLVTYINRILKSVSGKDYGYARSRPTPSLGGDRVDAAMDRALSATETEGRMTCLYRWYMDAPYWSKVNFLLAVLQMCDGQLLYSTAALARTMLITQHKGFSPRTYHDENEDYEKDSLADTVCSYDSRDHPENDLLRSMSLSYAAPISPFAQHDDDQIDTSGSKVDEHSDEDGEHITVDAATDEGSDSDEASIDPLALVIPVSRRSLSGVMKYRDFVRDLPVHLSKFILSFLEYADLMTCLKVSCHWQAIAGEVIQDMRFRQAVWEEVMLMQGSSAKGGNPIYASHLPVRVPQMVPVSFEVFISEAEPVNINFKNEIDMETSYSGLATQVINMETRNVYCGAYNVMVLSDQEDYNRIIHYNFGDLVAVGSFDRHVHFIDINSGREVGPIIRGHAGSIKSLYINTKEGYVLTGSFDTSIRCWHISSGKPMKIFNGHQGTIRCLDMFGDRLVSGSKDNSVKVWNFSNGKCIRTFKHAKQINCVAIHEDTVVSGCQGGRVKVWSINQACLIKMLYKSPKDKNQFGLSDPHTHTGPITCVQVDSYHIASASTDGYALVWSALGDVNKCIRALRHPKEVLSLSMMYLRLITGCEDGKLRIWNMLTGDCLRVMRGNSRSDPILTIYPCGNRLNMHQHPTQNIDKHDVQCRSYLLHRLALNTVNNLLILNFEEITWDYTQHEKVELLRYKHSFKEASLRQHSYSYVRAQRSDRAVSANPKLVSQRTGCGKWESVKAKMKERPLSHSGRSLSPKKLEQAAQIQKCFHDVQLTASGKGSVYQNLTDLQSKLASSHNDKGQVPLGRSHSSCNLRPKSSVSLTSGGHSFRLSSAKSTASTMTNMSADEQTRVAQTSGNRETSLTRFSTVGCLSNAQTNTAKWFSRSRPSTAKSCASSRPGSAKSTQSGHTTRSRLHMPLRGGSAPVRVRSGKTTTSIELSEARALQNSKTRIGGNSVSRDKLLLSVGFIEGSKQHDSKVMLNTSVNTFPVSNEVAQLSHSSDSSSDEELESEINVNKDYLLSDNVITPIKKIHPKETSTMIPKSCHIRPQTLLSRIASQVQVQSVRRCKSAASSKAVNFDQCTFSSPLRKKKSHGWTTSSTDTILNPPMLMHGKSQMEMSKEADHLKPIKPNVNTKISIPASKPAVKNPFKSHGEFHLRSRGELETYLNEIERKQASDMVKKPKDAQKAQRMAWKARATVKTQGNTPLIPVATEIGE